MNNWQRLGLQTREEGIIHVLSALKEDEARIMNRSLEEKSVITVGEIALTLNKVKSKKKKS